MPKPGRRQGIYRAPPKDPVAARTPEAVVRPPTEGWLAMERRQRWWRVWAIASALGLLGVLLWWETLGGLLRCLRGGAC